MDCVDLEVDEVGGEEEEGVCEILGVVEGDWCTRVEVVLEPTGIFGGRLHERCFDWGGR